MKQTEYISSAKLWFCKGLSGVLFFLAVFALLFIAGAVSCSGPGNPNGPNPDNPDDPDNPGNHGQQLEGIAVTTQPTKSEYEVGEALNTAGMVVTANYSDGTKAPVTDYTLSVFDSSTPGIKSITVTYNEKTAGFDVTVLVPWNGPLSRNATRLLNYLTDMYGEKMISGQADTAWSSNSQNDMIARVFADTGKYPALKGFDFINIGREQANEAIEWWDGKNRMNGGSATQLIPGRPDIHGIVTFCWHWRTGANNDFYANNSSFRIPMSGGQLDKTSAAFATIKSDLDKVAALLLLLKNRDIPVLWRPLHEAGGDATSVNGQGWFWWGAGQTNDTTRAAACVALWEYMYDYFTNEKGLNNLIWVWNGQRTTWFPNRDTVHIISYDVYTHNSSSVPADITNNQHPIFQTRFESTRNTPPNKDLMVALTENGVMPDPVWSKQNNILWSWFMTWNDGTAANESFWTGESHNTQANKTYIYNHDLVITLDELPDLTKYRLE